MKIMSLLVFLLAITTQTLAQTTYQTGDTLSVFTSGGLKLRAGSSLSGPVLATMRLGDRVVVTESFENNSTYFQTIEGFAGHWVQVRVDTLVGFAFDGFLSRLPLPKVPKTQSETLEEWDADTTYSGQAIEATFRSYVDSAFQPHCEPVEYFNGTDGEGTKLVKIQKLHPGFTKISTGYGESWSIELLMPNVRLSEIKNLILLLAAQSNLRPATFERVKQAVKAVSEEKMPSKPVVQFPMFWIYLKYYPGEDNGLKWSLGMGAASS